MWAYKSLNVKILVVYMHGNLPHFININIDDPYNVKALNIIHYKENFKSRINSVMKQNKMYHVIF